MNEEQQDVDREPYQLMARVEGAPAYVKAKELLLELGAVMVSGHSEAGAFDEARAPRGPAELRDALIGELDGLEHSYDLSDGIAADAAQSLATAAERLDAIVSRQPVLEQGPPALGKLSEQSLEQLCVRVWNATQEAGAATVVSDAALAVLREQLS